MALQAQVVGKIAGKRDPVAEDEVLQWCSAVRDFSDLLFFLIN